MKTRTVLLAALAMAVLGLGGCPKDNSANSNPDRSDAASPHFPGTWYEGDAYGRIEDGEGYQVTLIIEEGGKCSIVRHRKVKGEMKKSASFGTWQANGDEITLTYQNGLSETLTYKKIQVNEHLMSGGVIVYTRWRGKF